jgi:hypothetical protein
MNPNQQLNTNYLLDALYITKINLNLGTNRFICRTLDRVAQEYPEMSNEVKYLQDKIHERLGTHSTAEGWLAKTTEGKSIYHKRISMLVWRISWVENMIEEINLTGELK